ncbi:hypothetical protein NWP22_08160 [Anabaenopsis tanganyikae CS-531]|uniref:Uncharacterized protein n=2 Tax=Anabaenopsis TaxID=110103 RepID=A0ABT6KD92_9CYAN|nr:MULTISPECIES: hypothetical protein [Anabaenopsis]MDB9538468.1 hypothetical protein [Anabaenopsis arnoldii]MDH6090741.1 hypothetical protein [Anabaenopsis arnoldii]MDH6105837.1 hypothetical protein [Anabaenopsis tanganyikae CS-531]
MANIILSELNNAGVELFQDSESFLNELKDVDAVSGGESSVSNSGYVSDISTLTKLAEAFVSTYAIGHVTYLAKSFSWGY